MLWKRIDNNTYIKIFLLLIFGFIFSFPPLVFSSFDQDTIQKAKAFELVLSLKEFYQNKNFTTIQKFSDGDFKDFILNIEFMLRNQTALPPILEDQIRFTEDVRLIDESLTMKGFTRVSILWILRYPDFIIEKRKLNYRIKAIEFQYLLKQNKSKWFIINFRKMNENNLYDSSLRKIKK